MATGGIIANEFNARETSTATSVPNHPKARLMYYLKCASIVLNLEQHRNLGILTDYANYNLLNEPGTDALLKLVILLSPDELIGKVFFENEDLNAGNEFFELERVTHMLAVQGSVVGCLFVLLLVCFFI